MTSAGGLTADNIGWRRLKPFAWLRRSPDSHFFRWLESRDWYQTEIDARDVTTALDERPTADSRQIVVGWSAFAVDIETNPAAGDRIFKIGAVRSDNDSVLSLSTGRLDPAVNRTGFRGGLLA